MAGRSMSYSRDFYKKDFGLSQHRLALPENDPKKKNLKRKKKKSIGDRIMNIFHRTPTDKPTADALHTRPQRTALDIRNGPASGRRMPVAAGPSPLHSRVLRNDSLSLKGSQSSLDSVLQEYGYKKDGTPLLGRKRVQPNDTLIRLTINSEERDDEHHVTLMKSKDGFGIHLSVGPPPVSVTLVEPGSEAMAAGVREGDIIVEVNGKDCRSMEALELSELMELKSLIQHIPSISSVECARRVYRTSGVTVTSIESDSYSSDSSDSEREDEEREVHTNKRRQKRITKGIWNRIKAEGLADSGSESGGSFINLPITTIESSSDEEDFMQSWNGKVNGKVEIDEKEWRRMKQQQELIFNDTPSSVMNKQQSFNSKTRKHSPRLGLRNETFKWPFGRSAPPSNNSTENKRTERTTSPLELSVTRILQSSENDTFSDGSFDRPVILEQVSVERQRPLLPTRSNSMIVASNNVDPGGIRKKRISKEAPPDIAVVQRTAPLLGVNVGRDRRNIAKARHARKPTKPNTSGSDINLSVDKEEEHSLSSEVPSIKVTSTESPPVVRKMISDPGGSCEDADKLQKVIRRRSSAALVEEAVRKHQSLIEPTEDERATSRRRKHAMATPYAIEMPEGLTAQIVANAAASKARMKKEKSLERHKSLDRDSNVPLKYSQSGGSHPLHKSTSFQRERKKGQEPIWVSLAKNKHDKIAQDYESNDTISKKKGKTVAATNELQSYSEYLQARSHLITETKIN